MQTIDHKEIKTVVCVALVNEDDEILLSQRPPKKHLSGLWEFPGGEIVSSETPIEALRRQIKEKWDIDINIKKKVGYVKHAYSHFKITLTLYQCQTQGSVKSVEKRYRWITPIEVNNYPFPKSNHKLFKLLNSSGWNV